jgi:hypothetical protein
MSCLRGVRVLSQPEKGSQEAPEGKGVGQFRAAESQASLQNQTKSRSTRIRTSVLGCRPFRQLDNPLFIRLNKLLRLLNSYGVRIRRLENISYLYD